MVLVTIGRFTKAIQNSLEKMDENTARRIAQRILNFFGYSDRIFDNILTPQERDVFNMLESVGLLSTTSEELTLYNGKEWRIYYWILNTDKIIKASKKIKKNKKKAPKDIYERIPNNVWKKHTKKLIKNASF